MIILYAVCTLTYFKQAEMKIKPFTTKYAAFHRMFSHVKQNKPFFHILIPDNFMSEKKL